jgi:hypothetical protein
MSGDITTILPKNVLLQNHQKHYKQQSTENFNFKNFVLKACIFFVLEGPGWLNELGSWITLQLTQAYHQYGMGSPTAL